MNPSPLSFTRNLTTTLISKLDRKSHVIAHMKFGFLLTALLASGCAPSGSGKKSDAAPTAAPSPASVPEASCFRPQLVAPKGPEIPMSLLIDGGAGVYRLTDLQGMIRFQSGELQSSLNVRLTVDFGVDPQNPGTAGTLACADFSQDKDGGLTGSFKSPLFIHRDSGKIENGLYGDVNASARNAGDSSLSVRTAPFAPPSLSALAAELKKSSAHLRLYRVDATTVQLVITGKVAQGAASFEGVSSAIYVLQAATPAPAPEVPQAPAPVPEVPRNPAPAPEVRADIAAICDEQYSTQAQVDCLLKFRTSAPAPLVVPICAQQYSPSAKVACLEQLNGKSFDAKILPVCEAQYSPSAKKDCLKRLADATYSEQAVTVCRRHASPSSQEDCLAKFRN